MRVNQLFLLINLLLSNMLTLFFLLHDQIPMTMMQSVGTTVVQTQRTPGHNQIQSLPKNLVLGTLLSIKPSGKEKPPKLEQLN